jgi:TRAP-type C4-dicarboxylate transport system permease small subunit
VQHLRGHVNVDLIPLALKPRARYGLALCTLSLSIAMVALILWHGYEFWHLAYERNWKSDTVWGVRLWIPYAALPIGFGLFLLQLIADLVAVILKVDTPFGLEQP